MVKESQGLRCNLSLDDDSDECAPLLWRREIFGKNGRKRSKTLRLFFLSCVRAYDHACDGHETTDIKIKS